MQTTSLLLAQKIGLVYIRYFLRLNSIIPMSKTNKHICLTLPDCILLNSDIEESPCFSQSLAHAPLRVTYQIVFDFDFIIIIIINSCHR